MAGQDLNLELIIKARADQAKAEIASTAAAAKGLQSETAAATEVSAARMSAALKSVGGDISKVTPEMLGLGAATAAAAAPAEATAVAVGKLGKNIEEAARVSPVAVNEFRALFDEISSGRTYRSPGTIAIIAQKVLGLSTTALVAAGSVAILTAGLGYLGYEALEERKRLDDLEKSFELTGRAAQFSSQWISYESDFLRSLPGVTTAAVNEFQQFVAQHAQIGAVLANQVGQLLPAYIHQLGKQAPQAAGKLALALSDLTEAGFQKLNKELLNLNPQEYETIQNLIKIGDTAAATKRILDDLSDQSGNYVKKLGDQVYDTLQKIAALKKRRTELEQPQNAARDSTGLELIRVNNQIIAQEEHLADIRKQEAQDGKQAADNNYNDQRDAADRVNDSLDRQGKIIKQIAVFQKDLVEARKRDDPAGIKKFTDAITNEKTALQKLKDQENRHVTGFGSEGEKEIAQAREKVSEINAIEGLGAQDRLAKIKTVWATLLTGDKLNASQRLQVQRDLNNAVAKAEKDASRDRDQIAHADADTALQLARIAYQQRKNELDQEVAEGRITSQQKLAELKSYLLQIEKLQLDELTREQKNYDKDSVEYARAQDQKKIVAARSNAEIGNLNRQAAQDYAKEWGTALGTIEQAEDRLVSGILSGTQSLRQIFANIADQIAEKWITAELHTVTEHLFLEKTKTAATAAGAASRTALQASESTSFLGRLGTQIAEWLGLESSKTAATATGVAARTVAQTAATTTSIAASKLQAAGEIPAYTATAAMGAASAVAPIPIVGPALALAAASSMEALGASELAIASARGGYWELPSDQIIMAHEREMVIPSREAEGLRNLINGGGRAQPGPSHTTIQALDAPSLMRLLKRNPNAIAAGVRSAVRNGIIR